ncbi:hypothetical protein Pan5_58 [Pseudanabaena phage Pan5]|nr:hypothetical protein Pan5_58 [Pseudanabaena phage Pan5]
MEHEFKGTTGLWKAIENEDCFEVCAFEGGMKYIIAEGIEQGFDGGMYDAHLIAAAPDLLEVVETFLSNYEGLKKVNNPEDSYALEVWGKLATAARAAISKALNQEV